MLLKYSLTVLGSLDCNNQLKECKNIRLVALKQAKEDV